MLQLIPYATERHWPYDSDQSNPACRHFTWEQIVRPTTSNVRLLMRVNRGSIGSAECLTRKEV